MVLGRISVSGDVFYSIAFPPLSFACGPCVFSEYSTLIPFSKCQHAGAKKTPGFMILFFTSRESLGEGFFSPFFSFSPSFVLSLTPSLFPLLHSIPFIHIQQSIIFWKKESECEGEREKSGDCRWKWYFFSCSYPPAFEPAMWKALGAPLYIAASLSSKAANRP